jgi:hypothetical protein
MPVIAAIVKPHILSAVDVVRLADEDDEEDEMLESDVEEVIEHGSHPDMHWGTQFDEPDYYSSVLIDGVTYSVSSLPSSHSSLI